MSSPPSTQPTAGQQAKSQSSKASSRDQSPADESAVANTLAGVIEVDTEDTDSSYPESLQVSDTSSLRSSILNYKWENGRRYHAYRDGSYWGPNDEKQQEAEDLMHELYRIVFDGKLHDVPLKDNIQNVLDVGCGTGVWAIEFADENLAVEVIGVDLSPIQPGFVPPNCRFEVDDITGDWTFPDDKFDFIHVRCMMGSVPDWVEFHKKALKHLKPGGWIEHIELSVITKSDDGTITKDSPFHTWTEVFQKLGGALGKSFFAGEESAAAMKEAGLVNVNERRVKLPIGTWPKDKQLKHWGVWNRQFLIQGLEGFSIRGLTDILGWTFEESQLFLAQMRKSLLSPTIHGYIDMFCIIGQKPEDEGPN